jgi:CRP-like cAMP-binding protein/rhodanese-related sulfurtransferase
MTQKDRTSNRESIHKIFEDIPEEKLLEIAGVAQERSVPAGALLFTQGRPGDSFYIIKTGRVRIYRKAEDSTEIELSVLSSGDSFGEMALLTGQPRSANAQTLEETHLIVLARDQFDRVLKNYPDISIQFVRQLAGWLRKDEIRLEQEVKQRGPSLAWLDFIVIIVISLLCGIIFNQVNPNGITLFEKGLSGRAAFIIEPETIKKQVEKEKVLFIDARPSNFFDERHIQGAVNIPYALFEIMYMLHLDQIDAADHIVVYGRTISSLYDEKVTRRLNLYGYKNVNILSGGLTEWVKKGYPTEP